MASKGKPAARAFVEIGGDDAKLRKVLRNLRRRMRNFFRELGDLAKRAGQAIAVGIVAGMGAALTLAVKFEDVLTRTKGVFGELANEAEAFSRALAGRLGRSVSETLDMVQEIGASFRAAGLSAASSFQLAARTASAAAVLADRLGVNQQTVQNALMQASRGRATGLQRLGLGISPQDLREMSESLNLDVQNSADQIRLYAAVLERVESNIDTNTQSIGDALDNGENASQRLARIYAQIRDQLTDLGQRMLPVFSSILAGVSVVLSQIGEAFSTGGIMGVGSVLLEAAKPFTDVLVAGMRDAIDYLISSLVVNFRYAAGLIQDALNTWYHQTILKQDRTFSRSAPDARIFQGTNLQQALSALAEHLKSFGEDADAAAKLMRENFEDALKDIQAGAETLRDAIDEELGPGGRARSILDSAGTFTGGAAFALERRQMSEAERLAREGVKQQEEANDHLDDIAGTNRESINRLAEINDTLFLITPRFA